VYDAAVIPLDSDPNLEAECSAPPAANPSRPGQLTTRANPTGLRDDWLSAVLVPIVSCPGTCIAEHRRRVIAQGIAVHQRGRDAVGSTEVSVPARRWQNRDGSMTAARRYGVVGSTPNDHSPNNPRTLELNAGSTEPARSRRELAEIALHELVGKGGESAEGPGGEWGI
jgi:hypothetical protein